MGVSNERARYLARGTSLELAGEFLPALGARTLMRGDRI